MDLPLNALRAFEVSARHLNFTRAAEELHLTQTAVSQHVKNLEQRLGVPLFRRLARGLALTDEGLALLPAVSDAFEHMARTLEGFRAARPREALTVGVVSSFAVGWLLPHLRDFSQRHPFVDLRLSTHNNRLDAGAEGLDYVLRFGQGDWLGTEAVPVMSAPLSPLCAPALAERLRHPRDLAREPLLRSFRAAEWAAWFQAAGVEPPLVNGMIFDNSLAMADAAAQGFGVALLPVALFVRDLRSGRLVRPFALEVHAGSYWLTRLKSRRVTPAMQAFALWLNRAAGAAGPPQ